MKQQITEEEQEEEVYFEDLAYEDDGLLKLDLSKASLGVPRTRFTNKGLF
jgi:hypothetical protein